MRLDLPVLVLNADFRPLSYFPLSTWSWQEAVKAVFLDRVITISEYDEQVRSPSRCIRLPSVIALKQFVPANRRTAFTRFNVFLRDSFACQYCGLKPGTSELTFDHVIPKSRGGNTKWENVVSACSECNLKKGNQLPHECCMRPAKDPVEPTNHQLQGNGRSFPPNYLHESWRDFLYWDTQLDES